MDKSLFVNLFKTVVLPFIPDDWQYGDDLRIYLDYENGAGWLIGTGPIGKNNIEYRAIAQAFHDPMVQLIKSQIETIRNNQQSSAHFSIEFNRKTEEIKFGGWVNVEIKAWEGMIKLN